MPSRFDRYELRDGDAIRCDILALMGANRWTAYAEVMKDLASDNAPQSRREFRAMLYYLRIDVRRALRECRRDFARKEEWNIGFTNMLRAHIRSYWNLFVLWNIPALIQCGFSRVASRVSQYVTSAYTGRDVPSLGRVSNHERIA